MDYGLQDGSADEVSVSDEADFILKLCAAWAFKSSTGANYTGPADDFQYQSFRHKTWI